MLGGFTYWAAFEDCRLLAPFAQQLDRDRELLDVVDGELERAQLGAIMHHGEPWQEPVIERARARWCNDEERPQLAQRLAFALGGLVHDACDEVFEPLYESVLALPGASDAERSEMRTYQDAHVFEQMYLNGHEDAFNRFLMLGDGVNPRQDGEDLIAALILRALQSGHTIEPDLTTIDTWQDRLFADMERLPREITRTVGVYVERDPEKVTRYVTRTGLYRVDDPIIQVAWALQRDQQVNADGARQALEPGTNTSAYGCAVERAVGRLRAATAFWRGESRELSAFAAAAK